MMVSMREDLFNQKNVVFLITNRAMRRYIAGTDIAEGVMLVGKINAYLTDSRYFYAAREKLSSTPFSVVEYKGVETVCKLIKSVKPKTVFADLNFITAKEYFEYKKFGVKLISGEKQLNYIFAVKTADEIEKIKKACEITQSALYQTIPKIKEGVTENQIKAELEKAVLSLGGDGMAFDTIVAFGKNSAVPHHETGETVLKQNQAVLIDFGAKYQGFCADMTRTLFFGKPTDRFKLAYKTVLSANEKAESDIKIGTLAKQAFEIANDQLKKENIDKYFTHSLGHGVGLDIHERPALSIKSDEVLCENTVFTVEPGVYFYEEFGVRIEDTVILTKDGVKRFFTDSKELIIIK